ncbi:MAG: DUF4304 domain-containing protein [Candidatus Omnitrophica bacterium]|nr:DUF4304 domain-containing protein [Candidatus Omnitrophota bacterium]
MSSKLFMKLIAEKNHELLKPIGFHKKGLNFLCDRADDVVLVIQLQSSSKTTKNFLVMTLNLGVFSKILSKKLGAEIKKPTIPDCHWRERIGNLSEYRSDKWWEVKNELEAYAVADEIVKLIKKHGLPALEAVDSTEKLKELWEGGFSPGLHKSERQHYLNKIAQH